MNGKDKDKKFIFQKCRNRKNKRKKDSNPLPR